MGVVSVIVPVYNVEKYLDRCIDSIVNQTYSDLEIILVDDGSVDSSGRLCDEWKRKDDRIVVIHKENGGLGNARNTGIEAATGDWISFIDSDDYIDCSTYSECLRKLSDLSADVCYFGMDRVNDTGNVRKCPAMFPDFMDRCEIERELIPRSFGVAVGDKYEIGSVCSAIYKKSLIDKFSIRFKSERQFISEDYVFNTDICLRSDKIVFIKRYFYHYYMNDKSLTHTYRHDRFPKIEYFYKNRLQYISEHCLDGECVYRAGTRFWSMVLACLKQEIKSSDVSYKNKIGRIKEICGSDVARTLLNGDILKRLNRKQRMFLKFVKYKAYIPIYLSVKYR